MKPITEMDKSKISGLSKEVENPEGLGTRHTQALMLGICIMLVYSTRTSLSLAIVAMTEVSENRPQLKVLDWTIAQKGVILGSYFWAYPCSNLLAGHLTRVLGPKYPLLVSMTASYLITLLSPYVALNYDWTVFCAWRVMLGFSQGFAYPSIYTHVSKWLPPLEKGRLFGFIISGSHLGMVLTMLTSGYLAASPLGWPSIFYCTGVCGILWAVVWLCVGADSPDSHPSISDAERQYIMSSQHYSSDLSKTMPTPWWAMITSVPVWALFVVSFCHCWGYLMLISMLPSYLNDVFKFDINENGLISTLPYLCIFILTLVFSRTSDFLIEHGYLTVSFSRKMWNTIAHWGGAAFLVSMSFLSSATSVVAVLTLSTGLIGAAVVGHRCNFLDLTSNFAGLLMGSINTGSVTSGILAPTITGLIVSDEGSKDEWMTAFYISAILLFFGNLVFITFGSSDVQPWNEPKKECSNLQMNPTGSKCSNT